MYKLTIRDNKALFFSKGRMADILGIRPTALENYVTEGCPMESDNRFYSPRVVTWLLNNANPATKIYPKEEGR